MHLLAVYHSLAMLGSTLLRSNGQIGNIGVTRQWRIQISNEGDSLREARGQKGAFVRFNKQVILPTYLGGAFPRGICVGGIYISSDRIISPNISPSEIKEQNYRVVPIKRQYIDVFIRCLYSGYLTYNYNSSAIISN